MLINIIAQEKGYCVHINALTFKDILNVLLGGTEEIKDLIKKSVFKELKEGFKKIPPERFDAVINKVDPFVKSALLRMSFCRKESTIDFRELLKPKRLVKSKVTEMNMQMIGSALVTKLRFNQL